MSIKDPLQKRKEVKILTKKVYCSYGYSVLIVVNLITGNEV